MVATAISLASAKGQAPSSLNMKSELPSASGVAGSGNSTPDSAPQSTGGITLYSGPGSLAAPGQGEAAPLVPHATMSSWMMGTSPSGCCGPTGRFGPIGAEIFFRVGPTFDVSSGLFGHELNVGWDIEGGGRTLFFNKAMDAAWIVTLSVSNINEHAHDQTVVARVNDVSIQQAGLANLFPAQNPNTKIPNFPVTVRSLNRTYVNLGGGREWYLWGSAAEKGLNDGQLPNWRVGFDAGGRYGSAKLELNEIRNRSDNIGGLYAAIFSDVEWPCGCCVITTGLRTEYGYT
ncbi:MAG: hypothetical protein ACRD36_11175, partial [Candidatus Acidiferrum sp.]